MDTLNRSTLDCEVERLQEKLNKQEPGTKEYHDIRVELAEMVKLANEDDKMNNELEIAKAKVESENEKMDREDRHRWRQLVRDICVPIATTLLGYGLVYRMNLKLQKNTMEFELDGHSYTSKFGNFQVRTPNPRI